VVTLRGSDQLAELIDPAAEFEVIGKGFMFTEGPTWNPAKQELVFSDIPDDARWRWNETEGMQLIMRPNFMGNGMVYEADGGLLVCEQVSSTLTRFRPDGERELLAFHYQGKYINSPNDVVTASDGSIYFTDPNYGRWDCWVGVGRKFDLDFQGVFRIPPGGGDLQLVCEKGEFEQPNGLAFSPDESRLYIDDSTNLKVFDVAGDGSLVNGHVVGDGMGSHEHASGNPDGMKVDELGNVWCTARGGIWVYSPSDELLGVIETPEVAGNLVWGGADLRTLFVTTTTTVVRVPTKVASAKLPYHSMA
jgi:gluconolactonase